jgi:hypothetical protein
MPRIPCSGHLRPAVTVKDGLPMPMPSALAPQCESDCATRISRRNHIELLVSEYIVLALDEE